MDDVSTNGLWIEAKKRPGTLRFCGMLVESVGSLVKVAVDKMELCNCASLPRIFFVKSEVNESIWFQWIGSWRSFATSGGLVFFPETLHRST